MRIAIAKSKPCTLALLVATLVVTGGPDTLGGQAAPAVGARVELPRIEETDLREWLTTLSADAMQGRAAFTEGYGLAAAYVAHELARLGVEPLGAGGTYYQPVTRQSYRVTRNSSITVTANGATRTFKHSDHVAFPALAGGKQTLQFSGVEFVGYGLPAHAQAREDLTDKLVVVFSGTPADVDRRALPRALATVAGRGDALVQSGAGAVIGLSAAIAPGQAAGNGRRGRAGASSPIDLTTVERVDRLRAPVVSADDTFFEFLMAGSRVPFAELRARADRGEPLDQFTLSNVRVTIEIDQRYEPVRAERTHNVVGLVPGSDPALRDTYVLFGAHLDHVGVAAGDVVPGRANTPVAEDAIWNGADDDGSGSSAVLAIAKAMATGPRPARSTIFVWHGAEEEGLLGSQAMADDPVVPLDRIQAVFNVDMIGRNRNDDPGQHNTVYVVGADRISTDLHNIVEATNARSAQPLTLDYWYNDPSDPESFYTRSDHYSYAVKGVPAAFFFTGPHADYHANTDTVDKILFPKLARITQLIYEAGFHLADRAEPITRDNRGPRTGRGFKGTLPAR